MSSTTKILLTGGSGFLGSSIVEFLVRAHPQWHVTIADLQPRHAWSVPSNNIAFISTDVTDASSCSHAIEQSQPDLIIHTAGFVPRGLDRYSLHGREKIFTLNVGGTQNMLDAAREHGVTRFIFTGSYTSLTDDVAHDYPNMNESLPFPDPGQTLKYGASKAAAETLVLSTNSSEFKTCSLRPSTICGREDYQLVPAIAACISKGETPFILGNGDNIYDFTFVDNVAHAHVLAVENMLSPEPTAAGHAMFISNGQPITFRDFMLAIWAQFEHVPPFTVSIPRRVACVAGFVYEWANWLAGMEAETVCKGSVMDATQKAYADLSKARKILGYTPVVDIWDGVRISCDALKQRQKSEVQKKLQ
ncbi:MAG: erg26, C-3 sterol dehydrogenase [Alyxoria varia]|nr:MAG: erg26, C-3 sterol dehydrogenase [Alyxoria varia]